MVLIHSRMALIRTRDQHQKRCHPGVAASNRVQGAGQHKRSCPANAMGSVHRAAGSISNSSADRICSRNQPPADGPGCATRYLPEQPALPHSPTKRHPSQEFARDVIGSGPLNCLRGLKQKHCLTTGSFPDMFPYQESPISSIPHANNSDKITPGTQFRQIV
jgi:hypothetical protein